MSPITMFSLGARRRRCDHCTEGRRLRLGRWHRAAHDGCRVAGHETTDDLGQTTTEYALVTLGAAAVALLITAWAGGTGKIGQLLDAVIDRVIGGM